MVKKPAAERERRDQEVLRANRELAAYFKGRRTEREARAALKIVKAYIRDRERDDPKNLRPLPGARSTAVAKRSTTRKSKSAGKKAVRRPADDAEVLPANDETRLSEKFN